MLGPQGGLVAFAFFSGAMAGWAACSKTIVRDCREHIKDLEERVNQLDREVRQLYTERIKDLTT